MTISIAAVSAADNSSELEIAQVEDSMLDVSSDVENNVVQSTNDFEILSDEENGNNFTSLQSTIDNGGLVSLSSDYVRVDGEYDVLISKNVTLFGNNHPHQDYIPHRQAKYQPCVLTQSPPRYCKYSELELSTPDRRSQNFFRYRSPRRAPNVEPPWRKDSPAPHNERYLQPTGTGAKDELSRHP